MKIKVTQTNPISQVRFGKVAQVGGLTLASIQDVDVNAGGRADGDVLTYRANTNSFIIDTPTADAGDIDGGIF